MSGGEKSQSLLQVSHGCAHVLVLKSAASVFTQLLRLGEVVSGEMHSWRERGDRVRVCRATPIRGGRSSGTEGRRPTEPS